MIEGPCKSRIQGMVRKLAEAYMKETGQARGGVKALPAGEA
jgi:hypothetical protein